MRALHVITEALGRERTVRTRPVPQPRRERPLVRAHEELRPVSRLF